MVYYSCKRGNEMTALEALELLQKGNVKIKREHWAKDEYVQSFVDQTVITSETYDNKRIKYCHYPSDTVTIMGWLWEDLMSDDWEVVE